MAKKSKTDAKIKVRLPLNHGRNANQDEFFSVNFKNVIIKRGQPVEVSPALAEVIRNGELAQDAAYAYSENLKTQEEK